MSIQSARVILAALNQLAEANRDHSGGDVVSGSANVQAFRPWFRVEETSDVL